MSTVSLIEHILKNGRQSDGFINATELCKVGGKRFNDWYRLKKSEKIIEVISILTHIPVESLIVSGHGCSKDEKAQDTWVHKKIAYDIAMWFSPDFTAQVYDWLDKK